MPSNLPQGMTYEHRKEDEPELGATLHTLIARHPDADAKGWGGRGGSKDWHNRAGHITWYETHDKEDPMNGEIGGVEVHPNMRRRGIASDLHNRAKKIFPKLQHSEDLTDDGRAWSSAVGHKLALGEIKAPADVDTLRDPNCPVCGDDAFDGAECSVCGFIQPPAFLRDPDLNKAQELDLRKDIAEDNPNAMQQEPLQPNDVANPDSMGDVEGLEDDTNANLDAVNPDEMPGSLPGEIQGEVQNLQTGTDGMVPEQGDVPTGPDGMPVGPQPLPAEAQDPMGKPFTQGPDMPDGPGGPEGPAGAGEDQVGLTPGFDGQTGAPQAEQDAVQSGLTCDNCGFQAEASPPDSVDPMDPDAGSDGTQAGDVCPYCGSGQLLSQAEQQGGDALPPVVL